MIRFALLFALVALAYGWESGCGISKYSDAGKLGTNVQVVGGEDARPNEFPWQVSIQSSSGSHQCGAIIISRNFVLTAAHCTSGSSPNSIYLRVGEHKRSTVEGPEATYRVSVLRNHQDFNWFTLANDIALMQTTESINLNENVAAACAPSAGQSYAGRTAVVSGWGVLYSGGPCCPDTLQFVQVPVIDNEDCLNDFPGQIDDGMLCAGGRDPIDACQMDSGGPLVVKNGNTFTVIGIVSWGDGCAGGKSGVYARVSTYLDWIGNV